MTPREEALRLLESLPDHSTWEEVLRVLSARAGMYLTGPHATRQVQEFQTAYGSGEGGEAAEAPAEETEMGYQERITIEPGKRSGKPCVRGLRMTVSDVLDYLASGMSEDEILADFPGLERADIRACLAFAADRERRLLTLPA